MKRIIRVQRRNRFQRVMAASGAAVCATALAGWAVGGAAAAPAEASTADPAAAKTAPYKATVSVNLAGKTTGKISNGSIGLAFESSTLNNGYRYDAVGDLPKLLTNLGVGVLRFGGDSVDSDFTGTTPRVADNLARLAKATGWSVLYSEDLVNFNAAQVKADAKDVYSALGSKLFAFGCGNEPDMYGPDHNRSASYSISDYLAQVNACYKAIRAGAPKAPLEGPDVAWNPQWLSAFAVQDAKAVKAISAHFYPLGCNKPGDNPSTLMSTLLSSSLAGKEVTRFDTDLGAVNGYGRPFILSETNSACSGGVPGLSNSYAAALWAIDYILSAAQHGVSEINFQGGLNTLCGGYTVLCQTAVFEYAPQPIYYGMLFAHLFNAGGFLPVTVTAKGGHLVAFANKPAKTGSKRVMLENLSPALASTTLHLSGYHGPVSVIRLTAPSVLATSGIKIQGAAVAADGAIKTGKPSTVECGSSGNCALTLAPYSAALVTLG